MMVETYQSNIKNEDIIIAGEKTFGVIDGATPLNGRHSVLMRYIKSFAHYTIENENQPLSDSIDRALILTSSYDPHWEGEPPSAAVGIVRIHDEKIEVAKTADVVIIIYGDETKVLDGVKIHDIDMKAWQEIKRLMENGYTYEDAIKKAKQTILLQNRKKLGRAYNALHPGCTREVFEWKTYPADDVEAIIIMSDGAYRAVEAGLYTVEDLLTTPGAKIIEDLRKWEKEVDPREVNFPFFSRHDDATIVKIKRQNTVPRRRTRP